MTADSQQQQGIIPDVPRDPQAVDKNGEFTASWSLFFDQLITSLQINLKPEGFAIPQQPTSNISLLVNQQSLANIIYDSTTNSFKGNVLTAPDTYTWKTFNLS
jgi:hypothetical protein